MPTCTTSPLHPLFVNIIITFNGDIIWVDVWTSLSNCNKIVFVDTTDPPAIPRCFGLNSRCYRILQLSLVSCTSPEQGISSKIYTHYTTWWFSIPSALAFFSTYLSNSFFFYMCVMRRGVVVLCVSLKHCHAVSFSEMSHTVLSYPDAVLIIITLW